MEKFGLTRQQFALVAAALALSGIVIYLPTFNINFHYDDVDFYAEIADSLGQGTLGRWMFRFANGHLAVIPSISYYLNYQYFERSVFLWHSIEMILRAVGIVSVFYILLYFVRKWEIAAFMAFMYASSLLYKHIYIHTSSFNHLCAVTFTFLSLALLCAHMERGPGRGWGLYAGSVLGGVAAIISSAMGIVVFPIHIMFAWAAGRGIRREDIYHYAVPAVLSLATAVLFLAMGTKGRHEGHLNVLFGLQETLKGIATKTIPLMTPKKGVSLAIAGIAALNMIVCWRTRSVRFLIMAVFVLVAPLMLSTSFREDFNDPGMIGKYHSISILGLLLLVGSGLAVPHMERVILFFRTRAAGWAMLAVLAVVLSHASYKNLTKARTCDDLRRFENLLGEASMEFSGKYATKTVTVPERDITIPCFPDKRPWIHIIRYSPPVSSGLSFLTATGDDNRLVELIRSNDKYAPILERLQMTE